MRDARLYAKGKALEAVDIILPPRCAVSGEIVDNVGMLSAEAWKGLDFISNPYCFCCGKPFGFDAAGETGAKCVECLDREPVFNSARSSLIYNEASRNLILGFKHGDKTYLARNFVPWLQNAGAEMLEIADYIIPVPLHYTRLIMRRYNQSAIMAQYLANQCKIKHLPFALRRTRRTPSQGHLGKDDRKRNVRKAFSVDKKHKSLIKDKKIILIDDVFTSGATVNECAKTLKANGSGEVHVLTLARVVNNNTDF